MRPKRPYTTVIAPVYFGLAAFLAAVSTEAGESSIEELFKQALEAKSPEYLNIRKAIVEHDEKAKAFLQKRREAPETWEEFLLIEILVERIDRGREIDLPPVIVPHVMLVLQVGKAVTDC